jgi:D-alanyl-D-alanine dipeptidase
MYIRPKKILVDLRLYHFIIDLEKEDLQHRTVLLGMKAAGALLQAKKLLPRGFNLIIRKGYNYNASKSFTFDQIYEIHIDEDLSRFDYSTSDVVDISIANNVSKELNFGGIKNDERDSLFYYEFIAKPTSPSSEAFRIRNNRRLLNYILVTNNFENKMGQWYRWRFKGAPIPITRKFDLTQLRNIECY